MNLAMTIDNIEICDLRDRPEFAEEMVLRQQKQWETFSGLTVEQLRPHFSTTVKRGDLPVTLVAIDGGRLAGGLSLRSQSLGTEANPSAYLEGVSPWLSNMWVAECARGLGLATRLSYALEDVARELGFSEIYSSCGTEDSLYHKMGYQTIGVRPHKNYTVYQIKKNLCVMLRTALG